jgi:hypothetical protein
MVAACQPKSVQSKLGDPCDPKEPYICTVPFEVIYSDRDALEDRVISVDGVLGAGYQMEPPGSTEHLFVLFSSFERARVCNAKLAVELVSQSTEIDNRLQKYSGYIVTIQGKLHRSDSQAWAKLEVTEVGSPVVEEKQQISCMGPRPPASPLPALQGH